MEPTAQGTGGSAYPTQPAPQMSYEEFLEHNPAIGYLKVQASRAQGAIPISGVRIFIAQDFTDVRVLFFDGQTDADGIISDIELPAPPRAGTLDPNNPERGAAYQVYASHPDFEPGRYQIEIFEDVTAILPVTLRLPREG